MDALDMPSLRQPTRDSVLAELLHSHALGPVVALVELLLDDAYGIEVGTEAESALLALVTDLSRRPGVAPHIVIQIAFGEKAGRKNADRIARVEFRSPLPVRMLGGQLRRRPDERRVGRGIDLLRRTTAHIVPRDRPPQLCMLAWLHWARGQRTIALSYLDEAQRIEPENIFALGLRRLLTTRSPEWIAR